MTMERRTFLGAAAAAAALPTSKVALEERPDVDVASGNGCSTARFSKRSDVWSDVEILSHGDDDSTSVSVFGEWLDDEPGHVTLHVTNDFVSLRASVDPDEARELAADLEAAAAHADGSTE